MVPVEGRKVCQFVFQISQSGLCYSYHTDLYYLGIVPSYVIKLLSKNHLEVPVLADGWTV